MVNWLNLHRFKKQKKPLTPDEARKIQSAIQEAERQTSAELRVVVENVCEGDPYNRAVQYFEQLGMTKTVQRNGVLIYVARDSRKFAIIGDEGIHRHVGNEFWQEVAEIMRDRFRSGDFTGAIIAGIRRAGEVLAKYFPPQENDVNELPDEVVY